MTIKKSKVLFVIIEQGTVAKKDNIPKGTRFEALDKLPNSCSIHPELGTESYKLRRKIATVFLTIKYTYLVDKK